MKYKKPIYIISSIGILILMGFYVYKNKDSLNEIQNIKLIYFLPLILLSLVGFYLNGIFLKLITFPFNIKLKKHFLISIASSFFNLITPFRGGAGIRAIYMKKKYNLKYAYFISSLFGNYIIIFLTSSFLALIIFAIIYFKYQIFNIYFFLIFSGILLVTTALIIFKFSFKSSNSFLTKINQLLLGWQKIAAHPKIIMGLTINTITQLVVNAFKIQIVFWSLNIPINFYKTFYFSIISVLGTFLNITPGSLGITEGLYAISSSILEISPTIGIVVALILRGSTLVTLLTIGPVANYLLYKDLNTDPSQEALQLQTQASDE